MKQFTITNSMATLISIYPPKEKSNQKRNRIYSEEFQEMLDNIDKEDYAEESGIISQKKRRLSFEQVKELEKNFEVENKLEPERKLKLAEETGLNPRQVAIWFQNRRTRWKTKQLEQDYGVLETNYYALKLDYEILVKKKEALTKELKELKLKICERNLKGNCIADDEFERVEKKVEEQRKCENFCESSLDMAMNWIELSNLRVTPSNVEENSFMKMEEHCLFSNEESCNFLSVDHAPNLHWCIDEQ